MASSMGCSLSEHSYYVPVSVPEYRNLVFQLENNQYFSFLQNFTCDAYAPPPETLAVTSGLHQLHSSSRREPDIARDDLAV